MKGHRASRGLDGQYVRSPIYVEYFDPTVTDYRAPSVVISAYFLMLPDMVLVLDEPMRACAREGGYDGRSYWQARSRHCRGLWH